MNSINGKRLYCRAIEERILTSWQNDVNRDSRLSVRDHVTVSTDGTKNYRLWNTDLICRNTFGGIYINVTGNSDMDDSFYHYGRTKEVIMTQTTKSRLDAFLHYYGFDSLEVRSSKKDWSIKYNGEKLEVDNWYKLDLENKKLVLIGQYLTK